MIHSAVDDAAPCPLCGSPSDPAFRVGDRNRGLGRTQFLYRKCRGCRSLFNAEVPADLSDYYTADYYRWPEPAELDRHAASEQPRVDLIRRFAPSGRLVEIGAGFGLFARAAKLAGFEVTAIEMNGPCCDYLQSTVGVGAVCSNDPVEVLRGLPAPDVVAMWHSLEHVPDPWAVTRAIGAALAPGGVLALAMPNPQSVQFRLLGRRWAHVDAPRHLYLIPLPALVVHLADQGLHLEQVTCDDPSGRHWNRFGWERAFPRRPGERTAPRVIRAASKAATQVMRPLERRPLAGAAYTAVFVKRAPGDR